MTAYYLRLSLSMCLSSSFFFYTCLYTYLSIYLFIFIFVYPIFLSINCLSLGTQIYQYNHPYIYIDIYLSFNIYLFKSSWHQMDVVAHLMAGTEELLPCICRRRADEGGTRPRPGEGPDSLVLLDQLGSDMALEEGCAIAWVVVEALILHGATTILVTHMHFLT